VRGAGRVDGWREGDWTAQGPKTESAETGRRVLNYLECKIETMGITHVPGSFFPPARWNATLIIPDRRGMQLDARMHAGMRNVQQRTCMAHAQCHAATAPAIADYGEFAIRVGR